MKIYKYELDVALHARTTKSQTPGYADLPEDERNFPLPSLALTNHSSFGDLLFGIADLTRLQLRKCNNHLVPFIKVDGLSVSYIVIIFATIKSRALVYPSMECRNFYHH